MANVLTPELGTGLLQAGVAVLLALGGMLLARWFDIHVERDVAVALVRGIVQIVVVGLVLSALLHGPAWLSGVVLLVMVGAAAMIASRRERAIPGSLPIAFYSIAFGAGLVIIAATATGVIAFDVSSLIPVGSMLIANTMNTCAQALERFRADVESHTGLIEAGLALGGKPTDVVTPYTQTAIQASLIPRIDSLSSLGIVWIPGLMAGMVLSGANPVYAAMYQFAVIAMIFASSALTALAATLLARPRAFSAAEQLVLRGKQR